MKCRSIAFIATIILSISGHSLRAQDAPPQPQRPRANPATLQSTTRNADAATDDAPNTDKQPAVDEDPEKLAAEAMTAHLAIKKALIERDYAALAAGLADNGKPMILRKNATQDAIASDLKGNGEGSLAASQSIMQEIDKLEIAPQKQTIQARTIYGKPATVVRFVCPSTKTISKKYRYRPDKDGTVDADGNFVICMIRVDGQWYWNPYLW